MSQGRDREVAAAVRNMLSLGDPKWRKVAIAHIKEMLKAHLESQALVTLSSVPIISPFGLIIEENGKVIDFTRESRISYMKLSNNGNLGWLNVKSLSKNIDDILKRL